MEKLRILREKKGLTQQELADKMGITRQTVGNWEKGAFTPDANEVKTLSKILGVNEDELQSAIEPETGKESFYRDLIENNTDYALMPKAVFKDYKIVPDSVLDIITKSNEGEKQALIDKYKVIISGLEKANERLEKANEKLEAEKAELLGKITKITAQNK